jgi:Peptidase family M28
VTKLDDITSRILALPREAGTAEASKARELVADYLRDLGYTTVYQRFTFAPSTLRAFPLFGEGLGLLALILFPLLGTPSVPAWSGLAVWTCGVSAVAIVAAGVGLGWVSLGESPREDANLIATRGSELPRRWVVAHLDSKAQVHSMAGRLIAVWVSILAIVILSALAALRLRGPVAPGWLAVGGGTAILASFLARRGRLSGYSVGARDNGSGIVAALAAAEAAEGSGLGILITGAEEFGLVGARVFARLTPGLAQLEFLNVDTVDQEGALYLVSHDARGEALAGRLEPALARIGVSIRRRRLPLGIFVDSAPLSRSGAAAITIGRLTWATLRRIHTVGDTADGLSLITAVEVGRALATSIDVSASAR